MLKILAAILMVIDHVGVVFFPYDLTFRIIGRLSYPIFAFMIAEGARYTRNKPRYILTIGGLALICQLVYFFFANSLYMCILVTFTLSIITIYALDYFKKSVFSDKVKIWQKILSGILFVLSVLGVYILNQKLEIDYGFIGCMVPVCGAVFDFRGIQLPKKYSWLDSVYLRIASLSVGLMWLAFYHGGMQLFSLLAIPLLLLYSGKRGTSKLKYFFYVFYPVHLVILQAIAMIIEMK